ncbi:ATP synthase f chain, mitochondrial precursor [Serendipita sp. 411]|nr:ATP synthase f chain, mitochondrial precursor [Serendipita sp. 401]KAG8857750.1 ATP synthase f chain, mitochondrial precursor [Serendipita sp. 411]
MRTSLVRHALGGLVPPKIATPSSLSSGGGSSLTPLVEFYSKLPRGPNPNTSGWGLKARYFNGKNASGTPVVALIAGVFAIGYTMAYQTHLKHHKNHHH